MNGKRLIGVLTLLIGLVSPALAQTDQARIVGTVRDSQGGAVHSAVVTVIELKTSRERAAVTNDQGYFVITGLAPARYRVTAKAPDLEPVEINDVALGVGQERNIDIVLRPGTVTQRASWYPPERWR